jgi:hypothetical protein
MRDGEWRDLMTPDTEGDVPMEALLPGRKLVVVIGIDEYAGEPPLPKRRALLRREAAALTSIYSRGVTSAPARDASYIPARGALRRPGSTRGRRGAISRRAWSPWS